MVRPTFRRAPHDQSIAPTYPSSDPSSNPQNNTLHPSPSTVKAATRTRLTFALLTSLLFLIALAFLILVEVGNTDAPRAVVGNIYFLKLDLSNIIPQSVPQAPLINSIARTLGLHDFYQVGLWNYCEGYGNDVTDCSKPQTLYWFNPVAIILNQLLAGATSMPLTLLFSCTSNTNSQFSVALPSDVISALSLVRMASHWVCTFSN